MELILIRHTTPAIEKGICYGQSDLNVADSFEISFDHFSDVSASAVGLNDGKTPYINPGESHNLTVRYSFSSLTFGDRTISMTATSVLSQNSESLVSGTGNADFQVGAQGWITLTPPAIVEIREGGNDVEITFTVKNEHPTDAQLLRADIDRNSNIFYNIVDARVDTGDQNFVLEAQSMREIKVYLTATDENLRNLNNNSEIFKLPLNVDGDIDKVSMSASIQMFKIDPVDPGTNAGEYAGIAGNIIFILIGLVILVAVLLATFRIMRSASSPLEEISTFDDYEYTQGNNFNPSSLPTAPELPSEDKVANSMYGGSEEIFKQPPPPLPPIVSEPILTNFTASYLFFKLSVTPTANPIFSSFIAKTIIIPSDNSFLPSSTSLLKSFGGRSKTF